MHHQAADKILIPYQVSTVFNNLCSLMHIYLQSTSSLKGNVRQESYYLYTWSVAGIKMIQTIFKQDAMLTAWTDSTWRSSAEGMVDVVVVSCLVKVSVPTTSVS